MQVETSGKNDPLYRQARQVILDSGTPSVGLLQRRLKIGYHRALQLCAGMEGDILEVRAEGGWSLLPGAGSPAPA